MSREFLPSEPQHWLRFAVSDLLLARSRPEGVLLEQLCFHAQQSAEKAIKAVLIQQAIGFPRTHNLHVLLELLSGVVDVPVLVWQATSLTEFAVASRYPGNVEAVTDEEYTEALALGDAVLCWARDVLHAGSNPGVR